MTDQTAAHEAAHGENPTLRQQVSEYALEHGRRMEEEEEGSGPAWILSPLDTWEANPFYGGPRVPHPEFYHPEEDR